MSKDTWLSWYHDKRVEGSIVNFARILKEGGSARILDFGCGTGRNAIYLAKLGFKVEGFDWSRAAVEISRKELSKLKLKADLRVWDMNETPLPYPDSHFDGVLVMRVMHHTYVDKIRRAASEIGRITKRGGYLYVEVPTYEKAMRLGLEGVRSREPEPGTFVPLTGDEAGIPHHHFKKEELIALFQGFTPRELQERYEHYCLTALRT